MDARGRELAREHNDANVLVLPARFVGEEEGKAILKAWLDTPFAGGRHARRIDEDRARRELNRGEPLMSSWTSGSAVSPGDALRERDPEIAT